MNTEISADPKRETLQQQKTLNPKPQDVNVPLFQHREFFDPRDLVQVKYEMLRQVRQEGKPVKETASSFGFSRVAFYQVRRQFETNGMAGLLPRQRGPKSAHKLTDQVMEYVEQSLVKDPALRAPALVEMVEKRFGITIHRRSVERALIRRQKKLQS